ncbi:helix-turn-helix domain-containing protein [Nitrobacter sp. JJSN]|uniref:helix-turn-helix domain-containing protein n=1 Tax=Nitrobacter sp. JJSN TaxID=3453033 RepID=UPI003F764234
MGYQATDWAKLQRVGGNLKTLLLVIATYTNKQGKSWHKQATLADDAMTSTRTVQRGLVRLRELGLIHTEPTKRRDGGNGNLMITLLMDVPDSPVTSIIPAAPAALIPAAPVVVSPPKRHRSGATPPTLVSPPSEPSLEPTIEPSTKTLVREVRTRARLIDDEIDLIFDERFWPIYPKRGRCGSGRAEAKRRFRAKVRAGADVEKIIDATVLHAEVCAKQYRKPAQRRFIQMAKNWLDDAPWNDERDDVQEPAGETIFDLANHFEQRARANDHHASPAN